MYCDHIYCISNVPHTAFKLAQWYEFYCFSETVLYWWSLSETEWGYRRCTTRTVPGCEANCRPIKRSKHRRFKTGCLLNIRTVWGEPFLFFFVLFFYVFFFFYYYFSSFRTCWCWRNETESQINDTQHIFIATNSDHLKVFWFKAVNRIHSFYTVTP